MGDISPGFENKYELKQRIGSHITTNSTFPVKETIKTNMFDTQPTDDRQDVLAASNNILVYLTFFTVYSIVLKITNYSSNFSCY